MAGRLCHFSNHRWVCNHTFSQLPFQYATQRACFDECISQTAAVGAQHVLDGPCLCLLSRQLIFFYRQSVDVHRLVRMQYIFDSQYINSFPDAKSTCRHLTYCIYVYKKIWLCQNLVKFNSQFVKLLVGPQRQTCLFQIKRILGFCCRYSPEITIMTPHSELQPT